MLFVGEFVCPRGDFLKKGTLSVKLPFGNLPPPQGEELFEDDIMTWIAASFHSFAKASPFAKATEDADGGHVAETRRRDCVGLRGGGILFSFVMLNLFQHLCR
jgi:hypothetical protein